MLALLVGSVALAQGEQGNRELLRQNLEQRYQKTLVGTKLLGLSGGPDTIQRPGTMVVLTQEGLSASLNPDLPASYAIREGQADLIRGEEDVEVPAGERFYIHAIYVGSDVVTLGLVSVRAQSAPAGTGRVWVALNFFFPSSVLAEGDTVSIYSSLDQWLAPAEASGFAGRARAEAVWEPPKASPVELKTGMTREQVLENLGPPNREIVFGDRSWLTYGGLVVVLEEGQLVAVNDLHPAPAQVTVVSEPEGAEVYVDETFVGSSPAELAMPAGVYLVDVRFPGYADWRRKLRVFAGSRLTVRARLANAP